MDLVPFAPFDDGVSVRYTRAGASPQFVHATVRDEGDVRALFADARGGDVVLEVGRHELDPSVGDTLVWGETVRAVVAVVSSATPGHLGVRLLCRAAEVLLTDEADDDE